MKLRLAIAGVAVAVAIGLTTLLSMSHGSMSHTTSTGQTHSSHVVSNKPMTGRYGRTAPAPMPVTMPKEHAVHRPTRPAPNPTPTTVVTPPPPTTANPIPQGNGGDQDGDNSGASSDGDGNI